MLQSGRRRCREEEGMCQMCTSHLSTERLKSQVVSPSKRNVHQSVYCF